jgi:ferritin-like metal-binding protein YciE
MAENAKDKIIRYLEDTYAAEQGGLKALNTMLEEATDPELKSAISEHIQVSESQAERLKARIEALGGKASGGKSVVDSIIAVGSHFANIFHDKEDKQTQDVVKAASLEEFEVGAYNALKAYAGAVGDHETAQLADSIMNEEMLARERLARLVPKIAALSIAKTSGATVTT